MTPRITPEMQEALAANPNQPLYVLDASIGKSYVLIAATTFEKVQPLIYDASEADVSELLPLAQQALASDWDAPGMELYDDYDKHRPTT